MNKNVRSLNQWIIENIPADVLGHENKNIPRHSGSTVPSVRKHTQKHARRAKPWVPSGSSSLSFHHHVDNNKGRLIETIDVDEEDTSGVLLVEDLEGPAEYARSLSYAGQKSSKVSDEDTEDDDPELLRIHGSVAELEQSGSYPCASEVTYSSYLRGWDGANGSAENVILGYDMAATSRSAFSPTPADQPKFLRRARKRAEQADFLASGALCEAFFQQPPIPILCSTLCVCVFFISFSSFSFCLFFPFFFLNL